MKRKYIYLAIVLIVLIVIYFFSIGLISHKKKQASDLLDKTSQVEHLDILSNKKTLSDNSKIGERKPRIKKINIPKKNDIETNLPLEFYVTSFNLNSFKEPYIELSKKSFSLTNPFFFDKNIINQTPTPRKLFYFNPFREQNSLFSGNTTIEKKNVHEDFNQDPTKHKLSEIFVANNKYTKTELLKNRLKIKSGDYINQKKLQEHLNFINQNPFRNVNIILEKHAPNTYDIELLAYDEFPFRVSIGSDDTGLELIDRNRAYTGFNWNNAFLLDSVLSYQYLTSFDPEKIRAHTAHWTFYLPWQNMLSVFGDFSKFEVDNFSPSIIKNERFNSQASLRYDICLPIIASITHDLIFGFDFKRADTNLPYASDLSFAPPTINLTQFMFSYSLRFDNKIYKTKFVLEMFSSFGPMLQDEENEKYNEYRRFAKNRYFYAKGSFSNLFTLPKDFLFSLMIRGQVANENLLPSETLSVGGYNSVRGYFERQLNGDMGLIINTEIRTPSLKFFPNKKINDSLQFLAFLDYGLASIFKPLLFEEKNRSLIGYGPAIRYEINPYFIARLDWGFKGIQDELYGGGKSQIHFSVNLSY
ncbi:MAG: Heme/hemopexin transporter protein HuxB [Candidatus Anoxychlamydiales bacterium]|nr:Heme/hemopexin transporter protein HuxB [Candidatus Anoxychlamydiales bacterium]NGX35206.1 Heme/hemopexin transporter protein HuxB [Candidatus Anoxychlamydiales bacterium]